MSELDEVRQAADRLRALERQTDEAREELRRLIRQAAAAGHSRAAIAREAHVSRQYVGTLLR